MSLEELAAHKRGEDPTKVAISTDPRARRMVGTAIHGDTPFDVPYMSQIDHHLFVGGCEYGMVLPEYIVNLVSLYPWEAYEVSHNLHSQLSVRMYDSLDQAMHQVEVLASWLNVCCEDGPTLIHCQAGLNRSNLVAATALKQRGMTGEEAIALLREKRSPAVLCNPAFEEWLTRE